MILANAENSGYVDFYLATNLLNTNYKYLYNEIVKNSLQFTNTIEISEDTPLPDDCYQVISAVDRTGVPVHQSAFVGHNDNGWYVQNNIFHMPKSCSSYIKITYSTIPATLTAPSEWKLITSAVIDDGNPHFATYDEDTGTITMRSNNSKLFGKTVQCTSSTLSLDGEDVTEYLEREDVSIIGIQYHSPYIAVSYSDGRCFIFTGLTHYSEWNYKCITGHDTYGKILAMETDDTTGFGIVFKDTDTNKFYWAPFVPDTVLRYPNNTLFALLEYRIAFQIAGLLGMETITAFLQEQVKDAEQQFYNTLDRSAAVHRITKHNSYGGVVL